MVLPKFSYIKFHTTPSESIQFKPPKGDSYCSNWHYFFQKFFISRILPPSPLRLSCIPAEPKTYYAKEKLNILLFTFLLKNSQRKQAANSGSIEIITLYVFLRHTVSTHKNFSLHLFLKNGQVQYSFENKAYLKPCIYMKNR